MDKRYKTRDGDTVRILCIDKPGKYSVVGLIDEDINSWTIGGDYYEDKAFSNNDLVEVSEWDDFKIDDPVMVRQTEEEHWTKRYFAGVKIDKPTTWQNGATSWSAMSTNHFVYWNFIRKPTAEELSNK